MSKTGSLWISRSFHPAIPRQQQQQQQQQQQRWSLREGEEAGGSGEEEDPGEHGRPILGGALFPAHDSMAKFFLFKVSWRPFNTRRDRGGPKGKKTGQEIVLSLKKRGTPRVS